MGKDTIVIREIELKDDLKIAKAIRSVLIEFGVPKVGTAYEDSALDCMYETYDKAQKAYFVVVKGNDILYQEFDNESIRASYYVVCELIAQLWEKKIRFKKSKL